MLTAPTTPTSILRRMPSDLGPPSPARVTFIPKSLCDELDPIWRNRLQLNNPISSTANAQSCASSSRMYDSVYPNSARSSSSIESLDLHMEDSVSIVDSLDSNSDCQESTDDEEAYWGRDDLTPVHFFPTRDSIEISVSRSRASAMFRLHGQDSGAPNTPVRREMPRPSGPLPPSLDEIEGRLTPSPEVVRTMTKKPSALNLLAHRLVERVKRARRVSLTRASSPI
ncbi:hypothetical protein BKA62DRAFT_772034 [Auriculariales sp. MPI-PUGE-AT-0066]|nr:hypothetical protein BKA62DRAFT_772034 [Auriculariales sp. MPI-PUGE-AT-0066]